RRGGAAGPRLHRRQRRRRGFQPGDDRRRRVRRGAGQRGRGDLHARAAGPLAETGQGGHRRRHRGPAKGPGGDLAAPLTRLPAENPAFLLWTPPAASAIPAAPNGIPATNQEARTAMKKLFLAAAGLVVTTGLAALLPSGAGRAQQVPGANPEPFAVPVGPGGTDKPAGPVSAPP